jgi:chorismate synthase
MRLSFKLKEDMILVLELELPIAEAMANLVLIDHLLRNQAQCGNIDQKLPFVTE